MKKLIILILLFACTAGADTFADRLSAAAIERTRHQIRYDGSYYKIAYPGGDVPSDVGVCSDVIIRSYRTLGIDIQKRLHEDISKHFSKYPSKRVWGLNRPDTSIDHRRVYNLQVFFSRKGKKLPVTRRAADYLAGDLVTWMLPGNLPHIGIVTNQKTLFDNRPLIVHNIGEGPKLEDMLFDYPITGHYRYHPVK